MVGQNAENQKMYYGNTGKSKIYYGNTMKIRSRAAVISLG